MKSAIAISSVIVVIALLYARLPGQEGVFLTPSAVLALGGQSLSIALADTPTLRAQGLSGVTALRENEGMLFVFEEDGRHGFWMKDMLFPIDILWLSFEGEVLHIKKAAEPSSYPEAFVSPVPARYVLEVSSGWSDTRGIKIGDRATLPQNFFQ